MSRVKGRRHPATAKRPSGCDTCIIIRPLHLRSHLILLLSIILLAGAVIPPLHAQIELRDPGFPQEEHITYLKTYREEKPAEMVEVSLERVEDVERPHLLYRMESESRDMQAKIDLETLEVYYSELRYRREESEVHRINEVIRNEKEAGPGELVMSDGNGFDTSMRGFPWKTEKRALLLFLNGSDKFKLELKVKGKESIEIGNFSYECWKVQLGMDGFLGNFFPKSHFWYTLAPPHFLVRVESAGMGGGDEYIMELRSYTSRN